MPPGWFDPGLNMRQLPPGGPAPRMADGHPNLTGRYYPNGVGRMVGSYTPGEIERMLDASGFEDIHVQEVAQEHFVFATGLKGP